MTALSGEIAVIIVNYNTPALTLEAIESVLSRGHGGRRLEVHVVDNASPGGDAAILAAALSARNWVNTVHLRSEEKNIGFGGANNLVLSALLKRVRPPRYVFLLNPDARLENETVSILADFLDTHARVGAVGARIGKPDGSPVSAAFRFPGIVSTLASALSLGPVSRLFASRLVALPPLIATQRVDWVSGAAVMFRLSVLERIGFFDPTYFLYFEEVDLMRRMRPYGSEVWHVAEARVIHAEGASTNVRSGTRERKRLPTYWYQSWQHYFLKNHGRLYTFAAAAIWIGGTLCNQIVSRLRGRPPVAPLHFVGDLLSVAVLPLFRIDRERRRVQRRQNHRR